MTRVCFTGKSAWELCWPDAILRHQIFRVGIILGHAGRHDGFAFLNLHGDFMIRDEELGEQILLGAEAVGGEDGGERRAAAVFIGFADAEFRVAAHIETTGLAKTLEEPVAKDLRLTLFVAGSVFLSPPDEFSEFFPAGMKRFYRWTRT